MRYSSRMYAAAFAASLRGANAQDYERRVSRFVALLAKNGDLGRAGAVVEEFEKITSQRNGGHYITLEFARAVDKEKESALKTQFSEKDIFKRTITPSLIAGVRMTVDGDRELDVSLAGKLTQLFRN